MTSGCDGDHGECYDIGQKVTGQCYDAICKLSANKTVVYLDVTKGGKSNRRVNSFQIQSCKAYDFTLLLH